LFYGTHSSKVHHFLNKGIGQIDRWRLASLKCAQFGGRGIISDSISEMVQDRDIFTIEDK